MGNLFDKFLAALYSRRFLVAVAESLVILFHDSLGISEEAARQLLMVAIAWIIGDSVRETKIANGFSVFRKAA